jgi:hypothetical protein
LNRNRVVAGIAIFLSIALVTAAAWWLVRSLNHPRLTGQKILVVKLGYCGPEGIRPCITSFSQDGEGNMLVDILLPSSGFPNFYLTIITEGQEHRYECKKVKASPSHAQCVGREMQPGEAMQFTIISIADNSVLAEGNFSIIGLLLVAPGVDVVATIQPTESPTPFLFGTPTPVAGTPTPTATLPSYPNPTSYPNPYPNP